MEKLHRKERHLCLVDMLVMQLRQLFINTHTRMYIRVYPYGYSEIFGLLPLHGCNAVISRRFLLFCVRFSALRVNSLLFLFMYLFSVIVMILSLVGNKIACVLFLNYLNRCFAIRGFQRFAALFVCIVLFVFNIVLPI